MTFLLIVTPMTLHYLINIPRKIFIWNRTRININLWGQILAKSLARGAYAYKNYSHNRRQLSSCVLLAVSFQKWITCGPYIDSGTEYSSVIFSQIKIFGNMYSWNVKPKYNLKRVKAKCWDEKSHRLTLALVFPIKLSPESFILSIINQPSAIDRRTWIYIYYLHTSLN